MNDHAMPYSVTEVEMMWDDMFEDAEWIYEQMSVDDILDDMEFSDQLTEDEFFELLEEDDEELWEALDHYYEEVLNSVFQSV